MGKLTADQQKMLDELSALASAPDDDDDFDIVITDGGSGHSAQVPYRKGRSWLQKNFGIDLDPPAGGTDGDGKSDGAGKDGDPADKSRTSQRYFGKQKD